MHVYVTLCDCHQDTINLDHTAYVHRLHHKFYHALNDNVYQCFHLILSLFYYSIS